MDGAMRESPEGIGSVKAAISLYGQKFNARNTKDFPSKFGELQRAQWDMGRLKETKKSADKEKAGAESELLKAKIAAKELALEIEKSNAEARTARKFELREPRKLDPDDQRYSELIRELSNVKQELSRLKLDVANALESKAKAEKMIEVSNCRASSYVKSAEEIGKEIEEANEEHVLVELARIEAERECRQIEAQRKDEAARFSDAIAAAKAKIGALQREAREAKDLETKLAVTNEDVNVLQREMELVRAMERNFRKSQPDEESTGSKSSLRAAEDELKAGKKELESIKEESFRFMTSMDVIRKELLLIARETERLKRQEKKADSSIQQLNSKLLKAKSRLDSANETEERSRSIVSNLSAALQQLKVEKEAVNKERQTIDEQTRTIRHQIESNEKKIGETDDRLRAAMVELEAVKASEAVALKRLRDAAERTMKGRASSFAGSSTVTISRSEYEYLIRGAESAQAVADKKVAAAQAWIEALKAEEREIEMATELIEKEIEGLDVEEEKEVFETEEDGLEDAEGAVPKRSMRLSMASARKAKRRSSVSSGIRYNPRSPSFTIKRKKTAMPSLVKFVSKGSIGKQK